MLYYRYGDDKFGLLWQKHMGNEGNAWFAMAKRSYRRNTNGIKRDSGM